MAQERKPEAAPSPPGTPESLERFIVRSMTDFAVIATDKSGVITYWSPGAERVMEWTAQEMIGQPAARFFTPEDNAISRPRTEMEQALLTGRTQDERWHVRKNGERFWAMGEMMPLKDDRGETVGFVKVMRDRTRYRAAVTDMLNQNQQLHEEVANKTAAYERLWNNSLDLLAVIDSEGIFRDVNPAWSHLLGWDAEDVIGHHYQEFIHPEDAGSGAAALAASLSEERANFENQYRTKDGAYRAILWSAVPEEGLLYAVGKDVTVEKERERALHQSEEALRQAQKMEAVGQLTGGLAHDFNNMLAGVLANLEMLQIRMQQGRSGDIARYIEGALSMVNRAATLTHRLLAFSRRQNLDPKPIDVNQLIVSMEDLLRQSLGPDVFLETVLHGGLWTALCDRNQLESALLNLSLNSRDAMPNGGRLTVETSNVSIDSAYAASHADIEPGEYIRICVADTGTGMPPDVLARVLEPFFTTKPTGQGTGLGLSMIYGFVKQSKGHIDIHSELGRGTTIHLFFPRYMGKAERDAGKGEPSDVPRTKGSARVLLVDDEEAIRRLGAEMLGDLGYTVLSAADAHAALRLLESEGNIDLLITDVGLPNGMNGQQLADAMLLKQPHLRVLFITGFAENMIVGSGALPAHMELITKPFSMATFAAKVQSIVEEMR